MYTNLASIAANSFIHIFDYINVLRIDRSLAPLMIFLNRITGKVYVPNSYGVLASRSPLFPLSSWNSYPMKRPQTTPF